MTLNGPEARLCVEYVAGGRGGGSGRSLRIGWWYQVTAAGQRTSGWAPSEVEAWSRAANDAMWLLSPQPTGGTP